MNKCPLRGVSRNYIYKEGLQSEGHLLYIIMHNVFIVGIILMNKCPLLVRGSTSSEGHLFVWSVPKGILTVCYSSNKWPVFNVTVKCTEYENFCMQQKMLLCV